MEEIVKVKKEDDIHEKVPEKASPPAVAVGAAEKEAETSGGSGAGGGGGVWGGWGFSNFSYLSDLQKAAEEISRNAAAIAKSITDVGDVSEDSEVEEQKEAEDVDEKDMRRKAALDKLEKASEDSILSQGLKVFDTSVENIASGAWKAVGSAWKGGSGFIQKLEHSAADLAGSIQQRGEALSTAPSLLETGKALTAKGMHVLENVSKETMELLISETGIDVENNSDEADRSMHDDQLYEEMTFDRCFYIYGGPEQLEELAALSSHYQLLYNRRKAKLPSDQKTIFEEKLRQVQQIFDLNAENDASATESEKGKKIETINEGTGGEMKSLHDSSISKAADMAAGFTNALAGLAASDIIQRTAGRLESLHSEGVHRLTEVCCLALSQLLMLGKSVKSNANKTADEVIGEDTAYIDWPEDSVEKAKIIRTNAQYMTGTVEAVANSFITGISDVAEAYLAAIKNATKDAHEIPPSQKTIQEKASAFSEHLRGDHSSAVGKIQDGMEYLLFVVVTSSMPLA